MRRAFALLLALGGCNQIFDLRETRQVDAAFFDAPTDAPFSCPPAGTTPAFAPLFHQVIVQYCTYYTLVPDRGVATAICYDDQYEADVYEGPPDMPLTTRLVGIADPTMTLQHIGFAADGEYALALFYTSTNSYIVRQLERLPDGTWQSTGTDQLEPTYLTISGPTRGPVRHAFRVNYTSGEELTELVLDAGAWTPIRTVTPQDLGVIHVSGPRLSADGLRLMFSSPTTASGSTNHLFYTDRPSIDAPFRVADPLTGLPNLYDAYMNEDCSRAYFSGLESVFYVQRL